MKLGEWIKQQEFEDGKMYYIVFRGITHLVECQERDLWVTYWSPVLNAPGRDKMMFLKFSKVEVITEAPFTPQRYDEWITKENGEKRAGIN